MLQINSQLVGTYFRHYHLTFELTARAASRIFFGESASSPKQLVIVRLFQASSLTTREQQEHFFQEAGQLQQLHHTHILPLLEFGIDEGRPYLISDYAPNGSLEDRIQQQFPLPLPIDEALSLTAHLGQALQYAHQCKIVHGNLKPHNILFNARGDAVLADFHLVSTQAPDTKEPLSATTSPFASPTTTPLDDQYALASIVYEMLTGRKPFAPFLETTAQDAGSVLPPTRLNPSLPMDIEYALIKALDPDPQQRYRHIHEFINALDPRIARLATTASNRVMVMPEQDAIAPMGPEPDMETIVMTNTVKMGAVAVDEVSDLVPSPQEEHVHAPDPLLENTLVMLPALAVSRYPGPYERVEGSPLEQLPFPDMGDTPMVSGLRRDTTAKRGSIQLRWSLIIASVLLLIGSFSGLFSVLHAQHTPQNNSVIHATVSRTSPTVVDTSATPTVGRTATVRAQTHVASATVSPDRVTPSPTIQVQASITPTATPTAPPTPTATSIPTPTPTPTPLHHRRH
jgi:serine/threonine protein kinase